MLSLRVAREVLGGELTPDSIDRFVKHDPAPLARLAEARGQAFEASSGPLVPPLQRGELRPLLNRSPWASLDAVEMTLDSLWAALLYSHTAAVLDPLGVSPDRPHGERPYARETLHFLAAAAPLIDAGTLVLVPDDRLPRVELNFGTLLATMTGFRAAMIEAGREGEFHPEWPAKAYTAQLELLARTGWSVHARPLAARDLVEGFALRELLKRGRRRLWSHRLRRVSLGRFDSTAIELLTRVPVADLSDLTSHDLQLVRDEDAFGSWRSELTAVVAEYQRNADGAVPGAAKIAAERLFRRAEGIEATIHGSPALSALRAGMSTFAVSGSAVLAAFPVLSVTGRIEGLAMAAGSSLVAAGQRLVFHERRHSEKALAGATLRHYRGAGRIFSSRAGVALS